MDHLKSFENHTAYSAAKSELLTPNVSLCEQENEVHYNPIVDPRLIIRYNVTDASESTQIFYYSPYAGNGTAMFDRVEIDGVDVSIPNLDTAQGRYQLSVGEHTIKYTLKDPTSIDGFAFAGCDTITKVTIPDSVTSIGDGAFCVPSLDSASEAAIENINPEALDCER